jgi:oligopeptide/dipeptide ABC transporter ATP-binding protein
MDNAPLIEVKGLKTQFFTNRGVVRAVDGVTFDIKPGRTLGVLGESGCGKSVTAFSIMQLVQKPGRIVDGEIFYHRNSKGADEEIVNITNFESNSREMRQIRGKEIAMVFQEPMTSLDPVYTIGDQIVEAITYHQGIGKREARERAIDVLDRVRMPQPEQAVDRYPHQLSGGMRQRAVIAMALSCHPSLLIADEPTTALDVTTEAQILKLMNDLQDEFGMAIMYITHDLGVIAEMADEAIVMYLGQIVERADVNTLFYDPKHPYLKALLRSIPKLGKKSDQMLDAISGMVPDPHDIPTGCAFHPRCAAHQAGLCNLRKPSLVDIGEGHLVRCFHYADASEEDE